MTDSELVETPTLASTVYVGGGMTHRVVVNEPEQTEQSTGVLAAATTMKAMASTVLAMRESIEKGDLYLEPEAGEQIKAMLQEQMDRVDGWLERANSLARQAPFGENPVGQAMAFKFEDRAGGDGVSFRSVFTPYREILQDAHDAVAEAMNLYQQIENDTADSFKRIAENDDQV